MPSESGQDVKGRQRPTRVHITYKVETNGAIRNVEIPFVVGVMGDFKGSPKKKRLALSDPNRKFIEIAPDNFNKTMAQMEPRITPRVKNRLANDGSELGLDLSFTKLEDFEPDNVVKQIKPLLTPDQLVILEDPKNQWRENHVNEANDPSAN